MSASPRSSSSRVSRAEAPAGRILALDYGRRRIGVAVSDELGMTARPFATLVRVNRRDDLRRLREIARRSGARRVIIGHPLHLDGRVGEMAQEAERFAARLAKELCLPVEVVDERLTTWEAEQTLAEVESSSRRRQGAVDDVAAAVLLQEYLGRGHSPGKSHNPEKG